jgi:hypothetical protein
MIEVHTKITAPPDTTVLWRYMDVSKYYSILDTGKIYFTKASRMDDKYEGIYPRMNRVMLEPHQREFLVAMNLPANSLQDLHTESQKWAEDRMRETCYLSCWHMNPHQSAAMWKLYLKSDEGVAIRTTFSDMKRAFCKAGDVIYPATVKYIDYLNDAIPVENLFLPITHKRKSFEHEAEMRLIWWSDATANREVIGLSDPTVSYPYDGRAIPVLLSDLIQEVYVSPTSPGFFHDAVISMTKKHGLNCPVIKSDLNDGPVW